MLRDANAVATLAVTDLGAAAKFYEETLGLSRAGSEDNEVVTFERAATPRSTCTSPALRARTKLPL